MMARLANRDSIYVEGTDDEHVVRHLLIRHQAMPPPEIEKQGGKEEVLRTMELAIPASPGGNLGFVLDANDDLAATWNMVTSRLTRVGVKVPNISPPDGFIGRSAEYGTRVGVWLMPDNRRTGALEDFLKELIDVGDRLLPHAEDATATARALGATFAAADTKKAVLHAWLAWQNDPGRPYGVAIKAH